jgi:hypothetical protein
MDRALYLFCLARAGQLPELPLEGLSRGSAVCYQDFGTITAVFCEVPLDDFSGSSAESRLQDLAWIAPRATKHGEVIERVMEHSPVLPARFGTLFSSVQSLEQLLDGNIPEIDEYLESVAGQDEWAVKGLMSKAKLKERLGSTKIEQEQRSLASIPPGMRYFKERQLLAEVDKEIGAWIKEVCGRVATRLTEESSDWHRREILVKTQEDTGEEIFLNWAFLVARNRLEDFESRLLEINLEFTPYGVHFELSGPWPPYSFAPALEMNQDP